MPLPNPKLFDPITRIENATRRAAGVILTADDSLTPKDNELVLREIQEIRNALTDFEFAIQSGKLPGSGEFDSIARGYVVISDCSRKPFSDIRCSYPNRKKRTSLKRFTSSVDSSYR